MPENAHFGLLLSGGRSSRFPGDKLAARLGVTTLVEHVATELCRAGITAFEVGPGYTTLPRIKNTERRNPLAAVAMGWSGMIAAIGQKPPTALVVSGDLGNVDATTLSFLARFPGSGTVVPHDGSLQPLCARWSAAALDTAVEIGTGQKAHPVRAAFSDGRITWRDSRWRVSGELSPFFDVDTIEDLARLQNSPSRIPKEAG